MILNVLIFIDRNTESRRFLPATTFNIYVPRDEQFGHLKTSDFIGFSLKGVVNQIIPLFEAFVDLTPNEFDSFKEVDNLYYNGLPLPTGLLNQIVSQIPLPMMKEVFRTDGQQLLKFPVPQVIKGKKNCLNIAKSMTSHSTIYFVLPYIHFNILIMTWEQMIRLGLLRHGGQMKNLREK